MFGPGDNFGDAVEAENLVLDAEDVGEATLEHKGGEGGIWHAKRLAWGWSRGYARLGPCGREWRGLAHAGTHTAPDTLLVFV